MNAQAFNPAADPARYVPHTASESALDDLEMTVASGSEAAALVGPPGIGKTLLLRVLADRLGERYRAAYLPYPSASLADLSRWALYELGEEETQGDPVGRLRARALECPERPLLLLVDDADLLPRESLIELLELLDSSMGSIRTVYAALADGRFGRLLADFRNPQVALTSYTDPRNPAETSEYIDSRIHEVELAPEQLARFDAEARTKIFENSGGITGFVNLEAEAYLWDGGSSEPGDSPRAVDAPNETPSVPEFQPEEEFMGAGATSMPEVDEASTDSPTPPEQQSVSDFGSGRSLREWHRIVGSVVAASLMVVMLLWEAFDPEPTPRVRGIQAVVAPPAAPLEKAEPVGAGSDPQTQEASETVPQSASPELEMRRLNINARPWASIEIDGEPVGETPIGDLPLTAGPHEIVARLPDGRTVRRTVDLSDGDERIRFGD